MIGVYSITNKQNNKKYIGESLNIEKRWKEHILDLNNNKHHSYKLQNAYNECGLDNLVFEVEKEIKKDKSNFKNKMELLANEYMFMKQYNSIADGYNVENTLHKIISNEKLALTEYGKIYVIRKIVLLDYDLRNPIVTAMRNGLENVVYSTGRMKGQISYDTIFNFIPYTTKSGFTKFHDNNIGKHGFTKTKRYITELDLHSTINEILDDLDNHEYILDSVQIINSILGIKETKDSPRKRMCEYRWRYLVDLDII